MLRTDEKQWYQQFWPWFLIALPAVVIIACLYTVYLALNNPLSMVKKDYYQEGLTINKNIAELKKASQLGLQATIRVDENRRLRIELSSASSFEPPTTLILFFHHPVDDSKDLSFGLHREADHLFATELLNEQQWQLLRNEKHWYLQLQPLAADWLLQGEAGPGHFDITLGTSSG